MGVSADRTSCRFTDAEELPIIDAIGEAVARWERIGHRVFTVDDLTALQRIGRHAIGCSVYDLRDCEHDWIEGAARHAIGWPAVDDDELEGVQ